MPINTQPEVINAFNLQAMPQRPGASKQAAGEQQFIIDAVKAICESKKVVIKAGGGCRSFFNELRSFAKLAGAAVVVSPGSTGVLANDDPLNMHVGGSKGSISGNYAMQNAELLIVIGSRAVCQSDCSGVGYPQVKKVININGDFADVGHYNNTIGLCGDIGIILGQLIAAFPKSDDYLSNKKAWLADCLHKKNEWRSFLSRTQDVKVIADAVWGRAALTQPAAIKAVCDFAKQHHAIKFFDAGDVQANGFQTVEDDVPGETYTESGASYMGFATCAVISNGLADKPKYGIAFTGDGSFMMNPQALISAVQHHAKGMIVIFDNRRMAAISSLQHAQYGKDFRTNDSVAVDYVKMATSVSGIKAFAVDDSLDSLQAALKSAYAYDGLSVLHVPVYAGTDERGGLGAYGSWNVGNWCESVQDTYLSRNI